MNDWGLETQKKKGKNDVAIKTLLTLMAFFAVIILVILAVLYTIKNNTVVLTIDGKKSEFSSNLVKVGENNVSYVNIEEMAKLLGVQYHSGEYKIFSSDKDKCYVQSEKETASFYLNSDKVNKLKVGEYNSDYDVCTCSTNTIELDGKFYAPVDAIETAFNISLSLKEKKIEIITLQALVQTINDSINKNNTYNSLLEEDFNNQKALLYGYIIAARSDSNLYNVMTLDASKEIISDRYKKITFIESSKDFLVTNGIDKVGIINQNGQNKIDQIYDSIKIINNNPKLYMVENDKKYGVIDENGNTIIHNEYDAIGLETKNKNENENEKENEKNTFPDIKNQYLLLDSIIPVQKDKKFGLFDIKGNKVLDVKYDGIGCELTTVELNGTTKSVSPLVEIEECSGIVVKNDKTYDLFLTKTKEMISLKVSSMYFIKEGGNSVYYMIFKGQEMNLIENLTKLGYIKSEKEEQNTNTNVETKNNTVVTNKIENMTVELTNTVNNQQ